MCIHVSRCISTSSIFGFTRVLVSFLSPHVFYFSSSGHAQIPETTLTVQIIAGHRASFYGVCLSSHWHDVTLAHVLISV